MNERAFIRPDWTPATITLMVLGFVIFWPLGLAMLAYILFGEKLRGFKRDANDSADRFFAGCRRARHHHRHGAYRPTGNVAFDDWRRAELDRLDAERRRLDELREEFDAYARELRRAKDQEDFDRFMRERRSQPPKDGIVNT